MVFYACVAVSARVVARGSGGPPSWLALSVDQQLSKIHHQGPVRTQSRASPHSGKHCRSTVLQCFTVIHFQILSICSVGSVVFAKPILKHYGAEKRKHCIVAHVCAGTSGGSVKLPNV